MPGSTVKNAQANMANGTNGTAKIYDKDRDVERGEAEAGSAARTRQASPAKLNLTSQSTIGSSSNKEKTSGARRGVVGECDVEAGGDGQAGGCGAEETERRCRGDGGIRSSGAPVVGRKNQLDEIASTASARKPVGRLIWDVTLAMLLLAGLSACVALSAIYLGPLFLLKVAIVIVVAYFVSGGRLRWFYVAFKTAPRDIKAVFRYILLLWNIRRHAKKDWSVADVFRQNVTRHPNKICFLYEDQQWTFQEIEEFSNKVANVFKAHGYRKGDVVALLLENRPEYVAIWLGLSKLGIITPLINTNLKKASLLHSINVAKCQALIFGTEFTTAISDIAGSLDAKISLYRFGNTTNSEPLDLKPKDLQALMADVPATPPVVKEKGSHNDKLLYIYTSGTTGLPKAAVITSSRFMFISSGIYYMGRVQSNDRIYTPLPLYHTAGGIMSTGFALLHGNTVVIRKKFSASAYFTDCIKYKCTAAQYIGEMCRYILAVPPTPEDKQHNVRMMFGNGLRPQIWREFVGRFNIADVVEFYGATEGNANILNVDNTVGAIGFVSRIIPSVYPISIIKVDSDGEPIRNSKGLCQICEPDEAGVFIGKIQPNNPSRVFLGYVDESASQKKIVRDVFTQGDSAFISGDVLVANELGYLFFKDRTGDTYRWKGENVSTSEIEAIISNLVSYRDCVVYGVEVRGAEGRAGMAAIYDENSTLDLAKLSLDIRDQLPVYARPQFIRILTKIDLTGTFKLKKKELQEEGYDPRRVRDDLYYFDAKTGYKLLTPEVYDQIQDGKIRF